MCYKNIFKITTNNDFSLLVTIFDYYTVITKKHFSNCFYIWIVIGSHGHLQQEASLLKKRQCATMSSLKKKLFNCPGGMVLTLFK